MANNLSKIPAHVGIIMDGNRRWAKKRLLPSAVGHNAGMKNMIALTERAAELGVRYLTVYALSTENLQRPKDELDKMFELIRNHFADSVEKVIARGGKVRVIGDLTLLPDDIRLLIDEQLKKSPEEADFTFVMALCYGGRDEIVRAANRAVSENKPVTQEEFSSYLYTNEIPDPDFIIRTGGEIRLSNFLLWQAAYAELYFTDTLFPDFSGDEFEKALGKFAERKRRFGKE